MKFILKAWKEEYIEAVARYANNQEIAKNLRNAFPFPYTYEDAELYVKDCIKKEMNDQITRAIVVEKEAVGSIGVFLKQDVYQKSAEIGYWLAEPYWGKGIMNKAIKQICKDAFLKFDIVRIEAEPFAYNVGSRKALEKVGFELEGIKKDSVYKYHMMYDSCMYALLRQGIQTKV